MAHIHAVLIEFTRTGGCGCQKAGKRKWVSNHLAKAYVRRNVAKIIRRRKLNEDKVIKGIHAQA